MSDRKTFCIAFYDIRLMCVRLKANSEDEAIRQAEHLYLDDPGHERVTMCLHNPFCGAEAERLLTFTDIADHFEQGEKR